MGWNFNFSRNTHRINSRVFLKCTRMAAMQILASEAFYMKTKIIQWKHINPSGNRTQVSHNLWFQVQHSPFWTKLTFACKTETLGSLYSHALLTATELPRSKHQVVHEQKFKDLLSSTCQVSPERRVLDSESEVRRGPGSIPTGGNIFSLDFLFSCCKASDTNIGIIANFV